jgi:aspartate kinase
MAGILVQKYGGSSVADVERLCRVADRVVAAKQRGYQVVVVVSAMGNTTNDLMKLAGEVTTAPPRRELDMLLSVGERISMSLLSMAIHARGFEAISFTGSQSGILTNDRHFEARIIEVRPIRIQDELERGKIVIVAGFQGMSYKREITTLGRGGSDTTAVALAAALGAEACEIYSDVDGVYDADPRVVLGAERLASLDYAQMEEMARMGAKVLHAEAVRYARLHQVILHARATSGGEGMTVIRPPQGEEEALPRPAVTCLRPLLWVSAPCDATLYPQLEQTLAQADLRPSMRFWEGGCVELGFWRSSYPDIEARLQALPLRFTQQREAAVVSAIGDENILASFFSQGHLQSLVASLHHPLLRLWTAPLRFSLLVDINDADDAQRALHQRLGLMASPAS